MTTTDAWLNDYAELALRIDRQVTAAGGSGLLDHRGPADQRRRVAAEEPPPPGRLVEDAERLLDHLPFPPARARFLTAQVSALRTVARRLAGEDLPLRDYARGTLGIEPEWVPEDRLAEAHDRLAAALPDVAGGAGSLAERYHAWRAAHRLPPERLPALLPELVDRAAAECRARTAARIVELPDEVVDCQVVGGVAFHAAGAYLGDRRSTIYVNGDTPFDVAALLHVVAHEGHPGHIAEAVLKEQHLVEGGGCAEQQTRFLLSPQFVVSEGIGLHAGAVIFPGDEARAWLADHVYPGLGLAPDGADLAVVDEVTTELWHAWANAALLLADGGSDDEARAYLARWALLSDAELAALGPTLSLLRVPFAEPYIFCYGLGADLLRPWIAAEPHTALRRLLTEQLLPADIPAGTQGAASMSGGDGPCPTT